MVANPFQSLLIGNVIAEHLADAMQTYTIKEDSQVIHQRVPRQNIGIRIPGYTVTGTMKTRATQNITTQTQSFALRVGQALGAEAPASCIDDQPGLRNTFAQAPCPNPLPTPAIEMEARLERQRLADEQHGGQEKPAIMAMPEHKFNGGCCPGCVCNDCTVTLGGNRGKYCITCYKHAGLSFCQRCHNKRQDANVKMAYV